MKKKLTQTYGKVKKFFTGHGIDVEAWINKIDGDDVPVYSAQAAFFLIIAALPFIMLLIALVQFFIPVAKDEFQKLFVDLFPPMLSEFAESVVGELFSKSAISIISVTALTMLWSASRGVNAVRKGLNKVYHYTGKGGYTGYVKNRGLSVLYTLGFVLMLVFTLAVLVFGNMIITFLERKLILIPWTGTLLIIFKTIVSLVLLTLFFAVIYKVLPARKLQFRHQLPGAAFAAAGWAVFSAIYSLYINNFSNYSYIYGSLTAVVLMMLWVYFCMMILLIGAEINEFCDERRRHKKEKASEITKKP